MTSVSAVQVGSYFVQQYYQILQQQPDLVHQFYTANSTVVRVDGDSNDTASGMLQIHSLTMSINFAGIEIKTINSMESWSGGVLVVVSGFFKSKDFNGTKKFVQTFFLAPQEKGYFVLNDVFHFANEEVSHQQSLTGSNVHFQPTTYSPLSEPEVPEYALEVEARDYVSSVHIEGDDLVDEFTLQEQQLQQQGDEEELVPESVEEETGATVLDSSVLHQNVEEIVQEPPMPEEEESVGEPIKLSYASILRARKGKSTPLATALPTYTESTLTESEWPQPPQPSVQQPVSVPEPKVEVAEEVISHEGEGESKSVYVRNLPTTVTTLDILEEFRNFGKIRHDGVFIRNRKDTGVCFAFVEFEDIQSVQNAVKASPIQLAGRRVYIEERRANSSSTSRGGRRGGGRGRGGGFGGRSFGRGGNQDFGDSRYGSNGFRGL